MATANLQSIKSWTNGRYLCQVRKALDGKKSLHLRKTIQWPRAGNNIIIFQLITFNSVREISSWYWKHAFYAHFYQAPHFFFLPARIHNSGCIYIIQMECDVIQSNTMRQYTYCWLSYEWISNSPFPFKSSVRVVFRFITSNNFIEKKLKFIFHSDFHRSCSSIQ